MPEPFPQELVDIVVDGVGGGRGRVHRPPLKGGHDNLDVITYEALKNCALVAKSWTHRSHMNLFKEIILNVDGVEGVYDLVLPSPTSLQFVRSLEIYVNPANPHRGPMTLHLLTVFSVCPLEFLQIDGCVFSLGGRPALRACFDALSGRLLDITFRYCLFEPEPLYDILSLQDTEANIMFLSCDQDHSGDPARNDVNWEPVYHILRRKLCLMGTEEKPSEEFLVDLSQLSVQFRQLEVDFYEDGRMVDATQCLIDANAGIMSFLKLNVISNTFTDGSDDGEALSPPSLSLCVNLSELVLNMKGSYSCVVETPGTIFATFLDADCPKLSKITLEIEDARSLFLPDARKECLDSWHDLDSTLSVLATRLKNARGRKLVFVLEVTCENDTIRRAKKWLPRLLPWFHDVGSLHVHDGEDDVCRGRDYNMEDKRACLGRAVLAAYGCESESDEKTEETGVVMEGAGSEENQGGERDEGEKDGEPDAGNEGGDEVEEDMKENE